MDIKASLTFQVLPEHTKFALLKVVRALPPAELLFLLLASAVRAVTTV
jgi:hypothetical protein